MAALSAPRARAPPIGSPCLSNPILYHHQTQDPVSKQPTSDRRRCIPGAIGPHRLPAEPIQSPYIHRASGLAQIAVPTPLRPRLPRLPNTLCMRSAVDTALEICRQLSSITPGPDVLSRPIACRLRFRYRWASSSCRPLRRRAEYSDVAYLKRHTDHYEIPYARRISKRAARFPDRININE